MEVSVFSLLSQIMDTTLFKSVNNGILFGRTGIGRAFIENVELMPRMGIHSAVHNLVINVGLTRLVLTEADEIELEMTKRMDLLQSCLEKGADPNLRNGTDNSLVDVAIHYTARTEFGYRDCVRTMQLLRRYGADTQQQERVRPHDGFPLESLMQWHAKYVDRIGLDLVSCVKAYENFSFNVLCNERHNRFRVVWSDYPWAAKYIVNSGVVFYAYVKNLPDASGLRQIKPLLQAVDRDESLTAREISGALIDLSASNISQLDSEGYQDLSRLQNSTLNLYHLSRRTIRSCILRNHSHQLPDIQKVNEALCARIGPNLEVFFELPEKCSQSQ